MSFKCAIIGSVDIEPATVFDDGRSYEVETSFGHSVLGGLVAGESTVLVSRSPVDRPTLPTRINWRGIATWLKAAEVERVFATGMVGSLSADLPPGHIVVADQFLDFTKDSTHTLFRDRPFAFTDFTEPFCDVGRSALIEASSRIDHPVCATGCYVCVDGPRFETRAEVVMYRRLGGDVIGMTAVPEAILAREAGICYSLVNVVVNFGAGIKSSELVAADFVPHRQLGLEALVPVLRGAIAGAKGSCSCPRQVFEIAR